MFVPLRIYEFVLCLCARGVFVFSAIYKVKDGNEMRAHSGSFKGACGVKFVCGLSSGADAVFSCVCVCFFNQAFRFKNKAQAAFVDK